VLRPAVVSFNQTAMNRMKMAKADLNGAPAVVLEYKAPAKPAVQRRPAASVPRERIAAAR
jgi:hypothetical protein